MAVSEQKKLRVLFTGKAESVLADILKNYGFEETEEEFNRYLSEGKELKATIVRNIVKTMAEKTIPEGRLVELSQKHLEVSKNVAEELVKEIKEKLLPLLLVYPDEKFEDDDFVEEISKKIFTGESYEKPKTEDGARELIERIRAKEREIKEAKPQSPYIKKPLIADVEEGAEILKKEREEKSKIGTTGSELQRKGQPDKYRESV